jgi:hypothetical protein
MLIPLTALLGFKGVIDEVRIYNRAQAPMKVNLYCEISQTSAITEQYNEVSFRDYPIL